MRRATARPPTPRARSRPRLTVVDASGTGGGVAFVRITSPLAPLLPAPLAARAAAAARHGDGPLGDCW